MDDPTHVLPLAPTTPANVAKLCQPHPPFPLCACMSLYGSPPALYPPSAVSPIELQLSPAMDTYMQSASLAYNHYREKSLEERILRRALRRDAYFNITGQALTGQARRQFIRKAMDEELARGFLSFPREVEREDLDVRDFFRGRVEGEYNATRGQRGLLSCGEAGNGQPEPRPG